MIDCESVGEISRKDVRREKLQQYWIYWKSVDNIRKRIYHVKISRASGSIVNSLLIYGGVIAQTKNNTLYERL